MCYVITAASALLTTAHNQQELADEVCIAKTRDIHVIVHTMFFIN